MHKFGVGTGSAACTASAGKNRKMQNHESQEAWIQEVGCAKNKSGRSRPRRLSPESLGSQWERTGRTSDIVADSFGQGQ